MAKIYANENFPSEAIGTQGDTLDAQVIRINRPPVSKS